MTASRVWKNVPFINRLEKQVSGSFFCQYVGVNVLVCPTFLSIYSFMQAAGMLTSSCLLSHFQCPSELWSCIDSCSACCYDGSVYIVERQVSGQYFDGVVPLWGSIVIRISQFKHFPVIIFIMAWDKIFPTALLQITATILHSCLFHNLEKQRWTVVSIIHFAVLLGCFIKLAEFD